MKKLGFIALVFALALVLSSQAAMACGGGEMSKEGHGDQAPAEVVS